MDPARIIILFEVHKCVAKIYNVYSKVSNVMLPFVCALEYVPSDIHGLFVLRRLMRKENMPPLEYQIS